MSARQTITDRLAYRIGQLKQRGFPWNRRDLDLHEQALKEIDRLQRENDLMRARHLDRLSQELS